MLAYSCGVQGSRPAADRMLGGPGRLRAGEKLLGLEPGEPGSTCCCSGMLMPLSTSAGGTPCARLPLAPLTGTLSPTAEFTSCCAAT